MRILNPETLKALKGSIEKWEDIVNLTGEERGADNCPLCKLFPDCIPCPVRYFTGEKGCKGSPWDNWIEHQYIKHDATRGRDTKKASCPICRRIALQELDFLRSLLPKERP